MEMKIVSELYKSPFSGTSISNESKRRNIKKINNAAYLLLKTKKKQLKELKLRKKKLEQKLKKSKMNESKVIEDLLAEINREIAAIVTDINKYVTELISNNRDSKVAQRIVVKIGYQTVEGYLHEKYNQFDNRIFAKDSHVEKLITSYNYDGSANYIYGNSRYNDPITKAVNPKLITGFGKLAVEDNTMLEGNSQSSRLRR